MDKNPEVLSVVGAGPKDLAALPAPTPIDVLRAAMQGGVTESNIAVVERMSALVERWEERNAEKEFTAAFVRLQAELPNVKATKAVPNNDGTVRYCFAPFEDLMAQVQPLLKAHGFTISFTSRFESNPERIVQKCILQHTGGHKREHEFSCRIGTGPPKASISQADGAASTYAKRFALTDALNIVVERLDSDARLEGSAITPELADELERRVKMINADVKQFLHFAGAESFDKIHALKYDMLDQFLAVKEKRAVKP